MHSKSRLLQNWLLWAPRILAILSALFLGVFALDVFSEARSILDTVTQLLLHLIPTLMVLGILAVAWRREWFGAIAFSGFALAFVGFPWRTHVVLYGPMLLIAVLYLLSWWQRPRTQATSERQTTAV